MWVKGETLAIMRTIEVTKYTIEVVLSWHWNLHGRHFIVKSLLTDVPRGKEMVFGQSETFSLLVSLKYNILRLISRSPAGLERTDETKRHKLEK